MNSVKQYHPRINILQLEILVWRAFIQKRSVIKRPTDSTTGTTSGQTDTTSGQTNTTSGQTSTTNGQTNEQASSTSR